MNANFFRSLVNKQLGRCASSIAHATPLRNQNAIESMSHLPNLVNASCPDGMPNQKMEAASSMQPLHKDKMADGSGVLPPPLCCVVANLMILRRRGGSLKIVMGEQKQFSCVKLLDRCYRLKKREKLIT